ncbi:two-component sensor histidine [Micractinium conductrix]|uniref:Two-component sensor histidine n=1 Tax=Micractinium conductrix TaxID=554055 RepID=A0A2P6V5R7_9CHLO|nr:two-component sensor histidine [Micractinium conductrix]|eukprot:PSC69432.1 two-component sensor histidine [Micractinium conductrix]
MVPVMHGRAAAAAVVLLAALAAAADANPCWHSTHFTITGGLAACKTKCAAKLAAAKGVGSIWPEIYTPSVTKVVCCKCQYRNPAVQGDPSPGSTTAAAGGGTTTPSAADTAGDDPVLTDADLAAQQDAVAAGTAPKKSGFAWWKMAIVCGLLGLAILVTAAALFWDCCRCRRRKDEVAEVRDSVRAAIAKKKGGKGDDAKKAAQNEATKRLAALDLARAVRETKMEAQAAAPRFEVVVTAGSASAPSSPARSRFQRVRSAVNPFS